MPFLETSQMPLVLFFFMPTPGILGCVARFWASWNFYVAYGLSNQKTLMVVFDDTP
jgi:hypothetical protein